MIQTCHVVIDERFRAYHAEGSSVWMLDDSRLPSLRPGEAYGDWTRVVTRKNTAAAFGQWVTNQERNSGGSCEGRALLCNFERVNGWNTPQAGEGMSTICELASDAGFGSVWIYADFAARNAAIMQTVDGLIQPANYRVPMISPKSIPMLHPKEHGEQETIQTVYDMLDLPARPPAIVLWAASGPRGTASYSDVTGMFDRIEGAAARAAGRKA